MLKIQKCAPAGIGTMLADVPAGLILGRLGLKPTMVIGASLVAGATIMLAFAALGVAALAVANVRKNGDR